MVTELCSDSFSAADSLVGEVTPGNLGECQKLVGQLREELRQVLAERARVEAERKRKLVENFKGK